LLCLVVGTGCSTTNTKSEWADAMKDLRGENMQLRHSSSSLMSEDWDTNPPAKLRD